MQIENVSAGQLVRVRRRLEANRAYLLVLLAPLLSFSGDALHYVAVGREYQFSLSNQ